MEHLTAIIHTIGNTEYVLRNITSWECSYSEELRTFQNESGSTIVYPVRSGKRTISIKIEANSVYLGVLQDIFNQPVIHLRYTHGSDAECDCVGNIMQKVHEAEFIKLSKISVQQIADIRTALPNCGVSCSYGKFGKYDRYGRGAYIFSVTIEEV